MIRVWCQKITEAPLFGHAIVALIVINAIVLGLETSPQIMLQFGYHLSWINHFILAVFILEAVLKIIAVAPKFGRYFGDGWNLFDFSVVVFSLIPATGEFAMIARLARLMRVLRLVSALPELRLIIATLVRSIPSMGHVVLLLSIIFYVYAIVGFHLFHAHDPTHWRSLGIALLSLFRIVTLEDWTDVMYAAMEMNEFAWIYFVSFVVLGTFVVINLFIAVVLNNLDEAKQEQLKNNLQPASLKDVMHELNMTRTALEQMQKRLADLDKD